MARVSFDNSTYALKDGESVLDGLLRHGQRIPHSCKAGSCGSCVMRAVDGEVPAKAQAGLKDSWRERGYFLACVCKPEKDLRATAIDADAQVAARITALDRLSGDVLRVRIACEAAFEFRAGQYVTLLREDGLARSYSIASLPDEGELELHVRRLPNGQMSGWLHDSARVGDSLKVLGPMGECFYVPGRDEQPLLLIGTGTGLAPLYGILRDAIQQGHRGAVHLFHGAVRRSGLYLTDQLRELARQHPQVEYTPTVLVDEDSGGLCVGPVDDVVLARFPKLNGWRGFVCGDPDLVRKLKKKVFLAGMASRDIYSDAFLAAPDRVR
ncbi:MAG: 2Fe-2S iron-sulfur cluster-binding protein [Acidobacteriota bacterium]